MADRSGPKTARQQLDEMMQQVRSPPLRGFPLPQVAAGGIFTLSPTSYSLRQ
jgi:hypothetical protein